ncbi:hypothetical protein IWX76_001634 [Pedobacter sp. CAN_A7]
MSLFIIEQELSASEQQPPLNDVGCFCKSLGTLTVQFRNTDVS